ncbi:MAG: hypothetical protein ACYDC2_06685 [Solirubrobacteraceae bacterium]
MPYATDEARREMLETIAGAADLISVALGELEGAYELLDEGGAEALEARVFRPVQLAYGRARRTYADFAARHELPVRSFEGAAPGAPSRGAKGLIESAVSAAARADGELAALQDSMRPVEVGDQELRAGLAQVRELLGAVPVGARELLRTLGR